MRLYGFGALVAAGILLLSLSSCGNGQQLVSIDVEPQGETFGAANIPVIANAGSTVQLRALGTYIHPPVTKDITDQVTWASNDTQMMTVSSTGLLTATGLACGGSIISATVKTNSSAGGISSSGAIVTGSMTASVVCFTGTGTGGAGPILTVNFLGGGAGSVTSSPSGLNCTNTMVSCSAQFTSGNTVTLTATPTSPSTFGSWANCDSAANVNPCTITLTADRTVTVTLN
jgi:Big-like domain-containing protein